MWRAIVESVIESLKGDVTNTDLKIYKEIQAMSDFIQNAKQEISAIKSEDDDESKFAEAKDELDAVVAATEQATGTIMDCCEEIENAAAELGDNPAAEKITNKVTEIYEACTFQDITGQRINKVVGVMKFIEMSLVKLMKEMSGEKIEESDIPKMPNSDAPDADLMNGPQMEGDAMGQDDIDKLLADLDG